MMKVFNISAIALMIAGSSAFAGGCGKKSEEDSSKKTACGGAKPSEKASSEKSA